MISLRCVLLTFCCVFFSSSTFLCIYILTLDQCSPCPPTTIILTNSAPDKNQKDAHSSHKLAVIVPFRDRFDELLSFVPHMNQFLLKQKINHQFFILNQIDDLRFNRASLINAGFRLTRNSSEYFVIHDVDLLPLWNELSYKYPEKGVFHVSSPEIHPKYHYQTFLGGILIVKREDFEKVNGMSNRYWGWGLEDDELYTRLRDAKIEIYRPPSSSSHNASNTFLHRHSGRRRRRDTRKCFNQVAVTRRRDRVTGLHDVKYNVTEVISLTVAGIPLTVFNIALQCDYKATPWCQCDP